MFYDARKRPEEARKRQEEARRGQEEARRGPEEARRGPQPGALLQNRQAGLSDALLWKGGPLRPAREPPAGGGGGGPRKCQQKPSGLGSLLYTTTVGGARGAGMYGASRLALPRLRVRVFSPLAKLGPLRAPRGGCRALSEDFRV